MRRTTTIILLGALVGFAGMAEAQVVDAFCPAGDGSGIGPGEVVDNVKVVADGPCLIMGATVSGNIQTDEPGTISGISFSIADTVNRRI